MCLSAAGPKKRRFRRGFGVKQYEFDALRGERKPIWALNDSNRLSVLHLDKKRNILYVVDEGADLPDMRCGGGGRVFAFGRFLYNIICVGDDGKLCSTGHEYHHTAAVDAVF